MKKKFQVFISSTYLDLKEERQAAVEAVLEAGHIPAGMELFAAGNESQMKVIKQWIEESDIYMLILGGRYGSIGPKSQKSYIHREYEYAVSIKKPFFALVIDENELKAKVQEDAKLGEKDSLDALDEFRRIVLSRMSGIWKSKADIKLAIQRSLREFSGHEDIEGWISSKEKDALQDKVSDCELQIGQLTEERDALKGKVLSYELIIQQLTRERNDHKEKALGYELQIKQLTKERDALKEKISDYGQQIKQLTKERDALKEKVLSYELIIQQLTKERNAFRDIVEGYEQQIKQLTEERDFLKVKIPDYELQIGQLTKERDAFKEKVLNDELQIKQLTGERDLLKVKIPDYELQIGQLTKERDALKEKVLSYELQINQLSKERDALKEKISDYELQIEWLIENNKKLQKKIVDLEEASLTSSKYHGVSFLQMKEMLERAPAKILPREKIEKIKDAIYKEIMKQFLADPSLLRFYWIFSRLIDYGISKDDVNKSPEIYFNLKSLIDFGLVQREKREQQTFLVHTESGKSFLLQLRVVGDSIAKDEIILG